MTKRVYVSTATFAGRLLCVAFLLLTAWPLSAQTTPWVFKNEKDGVKVFYRKTNDVHQLKLVASVKTSLSGIVKLFNEVEYYPIWGYKVSSSRLIKKVSETEIYYLTKFDFPWPMDDRDVVMHSVMRQDPETKTIIFESVAAPEMAPTEPGVIRMTDAKTKWVIMPGTNGWAYIEYYTSASPGGSIPDWLVNLTIDMGPRETIKGIRKMLANPIYQTAKLAHVVE